MKKLLILFTLISASFGYAQDINMQNGTFNRCAPDKFYDSGGEFANYSNGENIVTTICPENAGQFIILDFLSFATQLGLNPDFLNIYDGDDTTANLLGTFQGPIGAFTVSASDTNASGCLTLEFVSHPSDGTLDGWEADILCATACQDIVATIDSTVPTPNGTGVVSIVPGDTVDFSGSATFSDDGANATYSWDFGDGNTGNGTNVSHTFLTAGTYTVTFTTTDDNPQGCTGTDTITVFVLGPNVVVDQEIFTPEQLVQDVLINSPCAQVSNIEWFTGTDVSQFEPNGIGYFFSDGINFPFEDGIILSSGNSDFGAGPNQASGQSSGSFDWVGDNDLNNAVGITSNNATYIQFDFVPLADNISFEFLMASEEYDMGSFECTFSDAFAFLLTDAAGTTTNLAVVPGTNAPILVTNIHPFNNNCPNDVIYPEFFGEYVPVGGSPIGYDGRTAVFTAQSPVTPGETYTIKLVIADASDTSLDSGVYLKAGSFDLGGDLGEDITIAAGTARCGGNSVELDTGVSTADHTWYFEGNEIPGETGSTLSVTETGTYSVEVEFTQDCLSEDSIFVEFIPSPSASPAVDLLLCDSTGSAEFDLSLNDDNVLGGLDPMDFVVSYHLSEQDAIDNISPLPTNFTNTENPQLIYARLADVTQSCYDIVFFEITTSDLPTINPVLNIEVCDDESNDGFEEFDLSIQTADILGTQNSADFEVTYHLSATDAQDNVGALPLNYVNTSDDQPIYVRIQSLLEGNCFIASTDPVFNLVVNQKAIANTPEDIALCDDITNDGFETFNLSLRIDDILGTQDPMVFNVSFHLSQDDANDNVGALGTNHTNTNAVSEEIFVRVEDPLHPECFDTTLFNVIVNPLPEIVAVTPLQVCDDDTDGFMEFPLSTKTNEILAGQTDILVTYHESLDGAQNQTDEIFDGFINTNPNNQLVYVRLQNLTTGCFNTNELLLEVIAKPIINDPTPLEACDDNIDGLTLFDLSSKDAEITGGLVGLTVSYHINMTDAELGDNPLATNYTNTTPVQQDVYVRVEDIATGCHAVTELQLVVNPIPNAISVIYDLCDYDNPGDGQEIFDLSTQETIVINGQANVTVNFYESLADANANTNEITTPYINSISNPQIVYGLLTNTLTGCTNITELTLNVIALPVVVPPTALEVCDDAVPDGLTSIDLSLKDSEITGNNASYSVSYHPTQQDAIDGTNAHPIPYDNIANPETVYIRVVDTTTGCFDATQTLELVVEQAPVPLTATPDALRYCDPDSDGFGFFTLTDSEAQITGGDPGLTVTYHETLVNAEFNADPIDTSTAYANINEDMQTVYVRLESTTIATDCYTIVLLDLIVEPTPQLVVPEDLEACDDISADGLAEFDLTSVEDEVLDGQDPTDLVFSYYEDPMNAEDGINAIASPMAYTNTVVGGQPVWVRVDDTGTVAGCYKIVELQLIVNPLPVLTQPSELELCDAITLDDEQEGFILQLAEDEILSGQPGIALSYHPTQQDAIDGTGALTSPYTNTTNPQTIFVRGENSFGCVAYTTLTLRVLPIPTPRPSDEIPAMALCDATVVNDGLEVFDLTENEMFILNGETGVTPTYHTSEEDALAGENAIADETNYTNAGTGGPETIYVRVTNDTTGCFTVVNFTITVNPLPSVVAVTDFIQCELNTDGFDAFDLTTKDSEVLAGQDPLQFAVSYHTSLIDAEGGTNALTSPYTNTSNPQEIFVRITDNTTGCWIATQRFDIEVQEGAQANPDLEPILYEACDDNVEDDGDPSNDSVQFDLSTMNPQVLDLPDATGYTVTYFASEIDANLNVNPLPTLYENITNPQEIYVRVDNDILEVVSINLDLGGLTAPLDLDGDGTDDTIDTDGDGIFDLIDVDGDGISDATDTNGDGLIDFVDTDGDGMGDPLDLDGDGTFDNQQDSSICFAVASLTLQVNPLPVFDLDDAYILCINTNGTEALDPLVLDTGLSEADYSFEWTFDGNVIAGATGSSYMPLEEGTYGVTVTDTSTSTATACSISDTTEVMESEPPTLVVVNVTQVFAENHVIEATASGLGVYEYSLDGGPWQESGTFSGVSAGLHEVTARDRNGCGYVTESIFVVDYPRYFTPNGDGNHDTWNIAGIGGTAKIYIFDRYGKLLKQISPTGAGWDGTYNGNRMPSSDYWFTVEYDEPVSNQRRELRAHFTLKR